MTVAPLLKTLVHAIKETNDTARVIAKPPVRGVKRTCNDRLFGLSNARLARGVFNKIESNIYVIENDIQVKKNIFIFDTQLDWL